MAYVLTSWAYREVISSTKLQQMSDNDTYLLGAIEDPWAPWTVVTNGTWTVGNGTMTGYRKDNGKTLDYRLEFTYGSTSVLGSGPGFTLPSPRRFVNVPAVVGDVVYYDTSVPTRKFGYASVLPSTSNTAVLYLDDGTGITATAPFTWAAGDFIVITGRMERA